MTLELKYQLLATNSKKPHRASIGAACFDLYVSSAKALGGGVTEYDSGVAFEIPDGYVGLLFPRSSISKMGQAFCNGVGVLDADFRGCVTARTYRTSDVWEYYKTGERFAQLMIVPSLSVYLKASDDLSKTDRGAGSYGSTGSK